MTAEPAGTPLAEPTPAVQPPPQPPVAAASDAPVPGATPPTDVKPATADSAAAAAAVTSLLATANDETKPTKREFTGEDYLMWFSNTFSMDKPRQILVKAPYFGPPAPPPGDGTEGEEAAGKKEKEGKEEPGPKLLDAFIDARDAYLDANEDYHDALEERRLAWHQPDFERDVLPKLKDALERKWDMMRYWCEVEGVEVCPPQEWAVAYGGVMYRGYP